MQSTKAKEEEETEEPITVIIQNQNHDQAHFTIKKKTALRKLIDAYHRRMGAAPGTYRLVFEGDRVIQMDTAQSLGLEDMTIIDAFVMAEGGCCLSI